MRLLYLTLAIVVFVVSWSATTTVLAADPSSSQERRTHQADRWRYTFHNNEWWYWLPAGRWVYWRDGRWNDYKPQTYIPPRAANSATLQRSGVTNEQESTADTETRPFYGRTTADLDQRSTEDDSEVGPFYGNVLPSDVFGRYRPRRGIRPFYGRAAASDR